MKDKKKQVYKDHMIQMENEGYSVTKQIVSGGIEN